MGFRGLGVEGLRIVLFLQYVHSVGNRNLVGCLLFFKELY